MNQFLKEIKSRLEKNNNKRRRFKLKTVMKRCGGYSRRSKKFVDKFNKSLKEKGLITIPRLSTRIPPTKDDWVYFKLDNWQYKRVPKKGEKTKVAYNFQPYPHQSEAWNHMDKHYIDENNNRGLVVLPTGSGKTTVAAHWLIRKYINEGYRILWLAHRVELLEQAYGTFKEFSFMMPEVNPYEEMIKVSGEYAKWSSVDKRHKIVFSTDRSAALNLYHLELMIEQSKKGVFIVIDEAHHSVANQYRKIIDTMFSYKGDKDIKLLGLTATPVRMNPNETQILWRLYDDRFDILKPNKKIDIDKEKLEYKSKIYEVSQERLIQQNILSKPIPITIETDIDFEKDFTEKDYQILEQFGELGQDTLKRITNSSLRNKTIVQHYKENIDKYGKTLVFAVDVAHCITLDKEFKEAGIDSDYVAYAKDDNAEVIESFKNSNSPNVLISVIKLTEGFDAPDIQTVFLTRPTRSETLLRQMIGRGLRGPKAGGTEYAHLVTFVDTWELFKPIGPEYIFGIEKVEELPPPEPKDTDVYSMPLSEYKKIVEAVYGILLEKGKSRLTGIYEAMPDSWYQWSSEDENGEREVTVFVFNNQCEAYNELISYYEKNKNEIPKTLSLDTTKDIIYKFFDDCKDPLPDYNDIIILLGAIRRGENINHFTFDEKEKFNPAKLARENLTVPFVELRSKLDKIFEENALCQVMYKNIPENFIMDVMREITKILTKGDKPTDVNAGPVDDNKDLPPYPQYLEGEGYNLEKIMESVIYTDKGQLNRIHFPNGEPPKYNISFTSRPVKTYFGICRFSDNTIKINKFLNSPKFPRFAMEFLVYHEVLHADMPNNGHDKSYRERERKFTPSGVALKEAEKLGYKDTGNVTYYWYTVSNQVLDTIHWDYKIER